MYVTIDRQDDGKRLVVKREPPTRAFIIFGLWMIGAVYLLLHWPDRNLFARSLAGGFFGWIGYTFLEEHQECVITKSQIACKRWSQLESLFQKKIPEKIYSTPVSSVSVITERIRYAGQGHQVLLDLEDGFELPLTMSCTTGPKHEHMEAAQIIAEFLNIEVIQESRGDSYEELKARTIKEAGGGDDDQGADDDDDSTDDDVDGTETDTHVVPQASSGIESLRQRSKPFR